MFNSGHGLLCYVCIVKLHCSQKQDPGKYLEFKELWLTDGNL